LAFYIQIIRFNRISQQRCRRPQKHGAVLLLGNAPTGKSTIGAILSTIAAEGPDHTVLKLTSPKEFEEHWNTHDRSQFFGLMMLLALIQHGPIT